MHLAPGTQVTRYVIEGLLGSGGMGNVYRAHDERLRRVVALKVLEPHDGDAEGAIAAALREARAAAAIHHPNVAEIFDVDRMGDGSFIVMEHVPGTSLRRFVGDASVDLAARMRWLVDVARALAAAHDLGVIHRDVKPENVIVRDDGVAKVLDFGVARRPRPVSTMGLRPAEPGSAPYPGLTTPGTSPEHGTLSGGGQWLGTPAYMAPEQIRGDAIDARADQFGWGVLAYELLAGSLPWRRTEPHALFLAVIGDAAPAFAVASGIPAEVGAAVLRALAKDPAGRFASMHDVVATLSPFAAPASYGAPESGLVVRTEATRSPPAPPPSSAERLSPVAAASPGASPSAFRAPDFTAPVDLEAHLAALLPGTTVKGMFFAGLVDLCTKAGRGLDLSRASPVRPRRYVAFFDYPMADLLRLQVAVAQVLHPDVPLREGLRRLGRTAPDDLLGSHVGKTIFGVLGRDPETLLLHIPKAHRLTSNCGTFTAERATPGRVLLHARDMPAFLDCYQVGMIEGVLRHSRAQGRVHVASAGIADATFEITLE
jgi:serine/threonine-protein kinase